MTTSPEDFSENSVLGHIRLNIYAGEKSGEINIFHEGEFEDPIKAFEYSVVENELYFIFSDDTAMPLGAPIEASMIQYFLKATDIGLFQMDDEGKPGRAEILPLKRIE